MSHFPQFAGGTILFGIAIAAVAGAGGAVPPAAIIHESIAPRIADRLAILEFQSSSKPVDCRQKAWQAAQTRFATCGPYELTVVLRLDPQALKQAPAKGWMLAGLGSAGEVRLRRDGKLMAERLDEVRLAGRRPHALSRRVLDAGDLSRPLHITLAWTGRECRVDLDGRTWLSFAAQGTRALDELTVGPAPVWLDQASLIAR